MRYLWGLLLLGTLVLSSSSCLAAGAGPVANYAFTEGSGNVLKDSAGGNDGRIYGAQWVKLGSGYGLKFDGTDDYVDCGSSPSLDITGPVSIEAWVLAEGQPSPGGRSLPTGSPCTVSTATGTSPAAGTVPPRSSGPEFGAM